MDRRARVDRTPEQKLEIVLEGLKSGNIAETCRRYEVAANLYYRWKDEALQGATAHKIIYITVDEKPEVRCKHLKGLVDLGRLELPTPWLQTRCSPS